MSKAEVHAGLRRWGTRGSIVGVVGAIGFAVYAFVRDPDNAGDLGDLAGLVAIAAAGGGAMAAMLYVKGLRLEDLRSGVGLGRAMLYMLAIWCLMVIVVFVAHALSTL